MLAAGRRLASCLRSSHLQQQLRRGLAIEPWFPEALEAHAKHTGTTFVASGARSGAGHPLGQVAGQYRSKYLNLSLAKADFEKLESLVFAWCKNEWQYERVVVPALLKYKELHGNMDVPQRFVVPTSDDDWPEEKMWGMQLGKTVAMIRSAGCFVRDDADRRQWLEEEGFVFDVYEQLWERAKLALVKYKELHGNMEIPRRFVVPSSDADWPEEMWAMELGNTVNHIRSHGSFVRDDADRRQWLEERGFRFETAAFEQPHNDAKWENEVIPALLKYKELHGNMDVSRSFVVPSSDADWPEETWGMQLGNTVDGIRSAGYFVRDDADRRQWLEEEGFVFDVHEQLWERSKLALVKYKELHGNMDVPFTFVVPSSDADWPEEMWGMQLGNTVSHIRSSGQYVRDDADRRYWLEEKGFVWKLKLSRAEKLRTAAKFYGRERRGARYDTAAMY